MWVNCGVQELGRECVYASLHSHPFSENWKGVAVANFTEAVRFTNTVTFVGATPLGNTFSRSQLLTMESNARYPLEPETWKIFDNPATNLPNTAASDDLAISGTAPGTDVTYIRSSDSDSTSVTQKCRRSFVLPPEYVAGQSVRIAVSAGMITNAADTSATLDVQAFKSGGDGAVSGADLYSGAAVDINSLTFAEKTFDLDGSGLSPGDRIDVTLTVAIVDGSTGAPVIARLADLFFDCDIKG